METNITTEKIKELEEWVGPTLVALASGTKLSREIVDWWSTGCSTPEPEEAGRLAFAHEILLKVYEAEGSWQTARNWFIGANVGADETSPAEAIRVDRFEEVRRSTRGIIEDIPYSAL